MDPTLFDAADRHVEQIAEILDGVLPSPELQKLRDALAALGKTLGKGYSVSLTCIVEIYDQQRERILPLLNTGLASFEGNEPHRVWGDSTPHRYLVDGQIQVVPHDRCPKCWEEWDWKWQKRHCPHCDAELGKNCKILLDSDVCPHCEEGTVTASKPKCSKCEFVVDQAVVVWG